MRQKPFLEKYSGQTTDVLIGLEAQYRVDSITLAFERAIGKKADKIGLNQLTNPERVVLAVEAFEREINNGGFAQFFLNSSGQFTSIIIASLRQIGCLEIAELTARAISYLCLSGPVTQEKIEEIFEEDDDELEEKLHECDASYYEKAEDLSTFLMEFIKANQADITIP